MIILLLCCVCLPDTISSFYNVVGGSGRILTFPDPCRRQEFPHTSVIFQSQTTTSSGSGSRIGSRIGDNHPSNKRRERSTASIGLSLRGNANDETDRQTNNNDDRVGDAEEKGELDRILDGWNDVVTGNAFQMSEVSKLTSVEDIIGIGAMAPLVIEAFRTAGTGLVQTNGYIACAIASFVCSIAHAKMCSDVPRDYRAPRLAEYKTVYEFSALYLVPFSWLLFRITTAFPAWLEIADPLFCLALTVVTIYGFAYAAYGKSLLEEANISGGNDKNVFLEPSDVEYQKQAQLYLTGNIVINVLATLFVPFAWTICFRGTEWWDRIQSLYPNQAAFLGVSILVAILGDVSGNLLLRLRELGFVTSQPAIVAMGIVSNIIFLLFPELIFNGAYNNGVSELAFYWD